MANSAEKKDKLDALTELVRDKYDNGDPSHNFAHIQRVLQSCKTLSESTDADLDILLPAALLHDVVNVPKNHPDRTKASEMAANEAKGLLKHVGFEESKIEKIAVVITEHSYSLGKNPSCIESAILQDADRLDALGAIGVMRTVTCGARFGSDYYHSEEPFARERPLDDRKFTLDHFFVKLLKLEEKMNTERARVEARKRTRFMRSFITQLKEETPQSESVNVK